LLLRLELVENLKQALLNVSQAGVHNTIASSELGEHAIRAINNESDRRQSNLAKQTVLVGVAENKFESANETAGQLM
jgi:hypothetical protein